MFHHSVEEELLAWAAGLFDGEGSTTCAGAWDTPHVSVPQAGTEDGPPEVLTRFKRVFSTGSINGPKPPQKPGYKPQWTYQATGIRAIEVLNRLWPHLGAVKRRQAELALERYRTHPTPHARIAAATGRPMRNHCRFGHTLADAYIHKGKRHCRTCRRLGNRRRRARGVSH